jgi:hypothetical protein
MNWGSKNATVVLVHGPWADGSSWREVICLLQRQGIHLISAPIPFTSLGDERRRALERTDGHVVLAGGRSDCAGQGGTAAHLPQMHPGDSARACLDRQTSWFLIAEGSHDQPEDTALNGRAHARSDSISCLSITRRYSRPEDSCGNRSGRNTRGASLTLFTEERGRK